MEAGGPQGQKKIHTVLKTSQGTLWGFDDAWVAMDDLASK